MTQRKRTASFANSQPPFLSADADNLLVGSILPASIETIGEVVGIARSSRRVHPAFKRLTPEVQARLEAMVEQIRQDHKARRRPMFLPRACFILSPTAMHGQIFKDEIAQE